MSIQLPSWQTVLRLSHTEHAGSKEGAGSGDGRFGSDEEIRRPISVPATAVKEAYCFDRRSKFAWSSGRITS